MAECRSRQGWREHSQLAARRWGQPVPNAPPAKPHRMKTPVDTWGATYWWDMWCLCLQTKTRLYLKSLSHLEMFYNKGHFFISWNRSTQRYETATWLIDRSNIYTQTILTIAQVVGGYLFFSSALMAIWHRTTDGMQWCSPPAGSVGSRRSAPWSSVFVQRRPPERGCYTCPGGAVLLRFLPSSAPVQRGTPGG